jgi:hypothetical protein
MFIGVFGHREAQIQSRFPKPGVAGSNPAEGADPRFPLLLVGLLALTGHGVAFSALDPLDPPRAP